MSDWREYAVPAVLMRGGTSKGVFMREGDVPADRCARDRFILALMGTPDPMQLDGLGGTHSSTSKVMLVAGSRRPGCDVDYTFVQVGIDRAIVDYRGNCGNLTAAVGSYAVDEGLVEALEPVTTVRLFNTNTGKRVLAHVAVTDGRVATRGDTEIAGVAGSGAALVTEYLQPGGSVTGAVLPTGRAAERLHPDVGGPIEASIVDISTPVVFVRSDDVGVRSDDHPDAINARPDLLARLESIRTAAAVRIGLAADELDAARHSAAVPRVLLTDSPSDHVLTDRTTVRAGEHDLAVRAISLQKAHHSCPLTAAMCAAAATRVPGSLPNTVGRVVAGPTVRIAHPKGVISIDVHTDAHGIASVAVTRTARKLFSGVAYVTLG